MIPSIYTPMTCSSAAHAGVFAKCVLRGDSNRLSLIMVFHGTADCPFVYRQLLPMIANGLNNIVPELLKTAINSGNHPSRIVAHVTDFEISKWVFRYNVVYD